MECPPEAVAQSCDLALVAPRWKIARKRCLANKPPAFRKQSPYDACAIYGPNRPAFRRKNPDDACAMQGRMWKIAWTTKCFPTEHPFFQRMSRRMSREMSRDTCAVQGRIDRLLCRKMLKMAFRVRTSHTIRLAQRATRAATCALGVATRYARRRSRLQTRCRHQDRLTKVSVSTSLCSDGCDPGNFCD